MFAESNVTPRVLANSIALVSDSVAISIVESGSPTCCKVTTLSITEEINKNLSPFGINLGHKFDKNIHDRKYDIRKYAKMLA